MILKFSRLNVHLREKVVRWKSIKAPRRTFQNCSRKETSDMTTPSTKPYVTRTGRVLSDADIDALADEVAGDVDVDSAQTTAARPPTTR